MQLSLLADGICALKKADIIFYDGSEYLVAVPYNHTYNNIGYKLLVCSGTLSKYLLKIAQKLDYAYVIDKQIPVKLFNDLIQGNSRLDSRTNRLLQNYLQENTEKEREISIAKKKEIQQKREKTFSEIKPIFEYIDQNYIIGENQIVPNRFFQRRIISSDGNLDLVNIESYFNCDLYPLRMEKALEQPQTNIKEEEILKATLDAMISCSNKKDTSKHYEYFCYDGFIDIFMKQEEGYWKISVSYEIFNKYPNRILSLLNEPKHYSGNGYYCLRFDNIKKNPQSVYKVCYRGKYVDMNIKNSRLIFRKEA